MAYLIEQENAIDHYKQKTAHTLKNNRLTDVFLADNRFNRCSYIGTNTDTNIGIGAPLIIMN